MYCRLRCGFFFNCVAVVVLNAVDNPALLYKKNKHHCDNQQLQNDIDTFVNNIGLQTTINFGKIEMPT